MRGFVLVIIPIALSLATAAPASAERWRERLQKSGFADRSGWMKGPCNLSAGLMEKMESCSFRALDRLRTRAHAEVDEEIYVYLALGCPKDASGSLDILSMNGLGYVERKRVIYRDGSAVELQISAAESAHEELEPLIDLNITNINGKNADFFRTIVEYVGVLKSNICEK